MCLIPFGGIGSTGILGAYKGHRVVCVELEERFVKLAEQNFELHRRKWEILGCAQPVIIQGDSRFLLDILCGSEQPAMIVSSPPHGPEALGHRGSPSQIDLDKKLYGRINNAQYGQTPGNLGNLKPGSIDCVLSSPPYAEAHKPNTSPNDVLNTDRKDLHKWAWNETTQGTTEGNLAAMKPGSVEMVLSSPPYAETLKGDGTQSETAKESRDKRRTEGGSLGQSQRTHGYGSKGNLGNLKPGNIGLILSSPPYEGSMNSEKSGIDWSKTVREDGTPRDMTKEPAYQHRVGATLPMKYGKSEGQLGNSQGDDFWHAARDILVQCHQILKPGGYAIWVVKSFVRKSKIVDFPADWRKLCEAVGFKTRHEHHAMLFKEEKFTALWGEEMIDRTNRNSFFRTLANNKAGWRTYWEIVPEDERLQWLALAKEQLPPGKRPHIVLTKAQELCFKDTAERIENWNDDVRIDYETVLCCQKQGD